MAPPRIPVRHHGAHRAPARPASVTARTVASLAVLVVLATLFLDALLIIVGLLTPVAASVSPLRRWARRLAAPSARAVPVSGR
ncbi:hypothetical protein RM555_08170 [Micromonospora sp. DSM 115977]|uniref:Uncharacterized protein n=1 Tax=Micromonospora reichwaldensis TaxID=3075516 RepID=A0ABU2WSX6_9ACTN|nr:hypothetical protein [Micromonospora sp. DSM 115977]MDT0528966.1 hypothetical protein [Micromonospora sp. DSM 115977]